MEQELKDMFKDTQASDADSKTPNVVSFKPSSIPVAHRDDPADDYVTYGEAQPSVTPKGKRKRAPAAVGIASRKKTPAAKKRKYTKAKPSARSMLLDQLVDNDVHHSMQDFIVPDAVTASAPDPISSAVPGPTLLDTKEQEQANKEKSLKKKREVLQQAVFSTMKGLGKGDNDIKAEMKRIEVMCEDDVDFEIQKIAWTQSEHFTEKVAQLFRDGAGWIADLLLKGDGKVKKEIEDDRALKDALQKRMMTSINAVGLNGQILLLLLGDCVHGKAKAALGDTPSITPGANNTAANNNNSNSVFRT